ncbi:ab-hydrolase associated lipase region family protein [Stylonychia lemnae]|uniref:Lipase n=1 Tax=Stylonychia lemnae TaxID=5949 RepID=A0A078AM77_STYLE|nr:ab-hydrolase associated lipase region family protein [Stylonychia lemnae]|eukprot:CDW83495.1 ab-hydrolase associated lipase region family protein [Stylonychia lemnae]
MPKRQNQAQQNFLSQRFQSFSESPDVSKTIKELITQNGFLFEEHSVTTQDGYILKMFRIPGFQDPATGKDFDPKAAEGKPVVLLQHGLEDSADAWVVHRPEVAPAFVLARAGYDVWLGNNRGNKYSDTSFVKKSNYDFWNYGYEEMGDYDLPAMIDYILTLTKNQKLAFIGHSQGTSQMFYALSHNEQYFADRVSVFIALGPVMRLSNEQSTLVRLFASNITRALLLTTADTFGVYDLFPANYLQTGSMRIFCDVLPKMCELFLYLGSDSDITVEDPERLQVYLGHFPSGTSLRTVNHYGQTIACGEMKRYDFGKTINLQKYGQAEPPVIEISNIQKVPVAMFVGTKDELANTIDNRWAKDQIKSIVHYKEYNLGHLSFFFAKDYSFFTEDVMGIIEKYHPAKPIVDPTSPKVFLQ